MHGSNVLFADLLRADDQFSEDLGRTRAGETYRKIKRKEMIVCSLNIPSLDITD